MSTSRWIIVLPPTGAARTVALYTAEAFRTLVPEERLKCIDTAPFVNGFRKMLVSPDETTVTDLFNQAFTVSCFDFKATHCLVGALSPLTLFTLNILKKNSISTGLWFYEDFHKATYIERVFTGYDHLFAIQNGALATMVERDGIARYHFLPTACGLCTLPLTQAPRPFDVVFIGIPSTYRVALLETLAAKGFRCLIAGAGWEKYSGILTPHIAGSGWCDGGKAFELMQQAKVGLNISFDDPAKRSDVHISPRLYDYAVAGCSIVTEKVPLLYDSFPDVIATTFVTSSDAAEKITAACGSFIESSRDRIHNRSTVIAHHQYTHRVKTIIDIMEK